MKKIWQNYKQTIILLISIIIGAVAGVAGIVFKEDVKIVKPLGDLFINLMFVIIVPLVFLTISTSISKMKQPKRLGKIMVSTVVVIIVTSIIAVLVGLASTYFIKLVEPKDVEEIKIQLSDETIQLIKTSVRIEKNK